MRFQGIKRFSRPVLVAALAFSCGLPAFSQEEESDYAPIAPENPTIRVKELEIIVRPLTKEELKIEADAWQTLIKDKVHEIVNAEVAVQVENVKKQVEEEAAELAESAEETGETPPPPPAPEEEITEAAEERAEAARERLEQEEAAAAEEAERAAAAQGDTPAAEEEQEAPEDEPTDKARFLELLNTLREERVALTDRANVVLAELDRKGGDSAEYREYLAAVARTRVDTDDIETLWASALGWLKSTEGGIRMLKNFSWFVGTLLAFLVLSRVAGKAVDKGMGRTRNVTRLMRAFVVKSVRRVVLIIGLIVALAQLEVSLNLVSVAIKTFDNKSVIVPNNEVWGNVITNATGSHTRRVDMVFGIGYGDDMAKAQSILERVVAEHPDTLENPEPVIRVHELADSSVNFICRPWCKTENYWKVYWDMTRTVKEQFDAEGVSIPFPQRDVHMYKTAD